VRWLFYFAVPSAVNLIAAGLSCNPHLGNTNREANYSSGALDLLQDTPSRPRCHVKVE
jgi:hypothetical protein